MRDSKTGSIGMAVLIGGFLLFRPNAAPTDDGKATTGAPGVQVRNAVPVPRLPGTWTAPILLSPNSRWAIFQDYGPGSSQFNIHIADLLGKCRPANLGYARDPVFALDGNSLTYWRYDLAGSSGLYLRNLETGQERRVYPTTVKAEQSGKALAGSEGKWFLSDGELVFVNNRNELPAIRYAVRLADGRLRRLGPAGGQKLTASNGRSAWNRSVERKEALRTIGSVWVAAGGEKERRVTSGTALDWLDAGHHLLVTRQGGTENRQTSVLFRVNVDTGQQRFLYEHPLGPNETLSPSRQWLGALEAGELSLVSTVDGRRLAVPVGKVSSFFWGRADSLLYFRDANGWRRADLRIGAGGTPAAPPRPDPVKIPLSAKEPVQWQPVQPYSGPWRTYRAAPKAITALKVDDQLWLGTTEGLRVLDLRGRELPLAPWQAALQGRRVDQIALDGERVWLATRRAAPHNPGDYESQVIRVDRRSGKAEGRFLEPTGFGGGDYVRQILPGRRVLALGAAYRQLELWDGEGTRHAVSPETPGGRFGAVCAAQQEDGTVWIGNFYGLYRWRPETGTGEQWTEKQGLPSATVLSVATVGDQIWVGTAGGLAILDPKTGHITNPPGGDVLVDDPVTRLAVTSSTLYAASSTQLAAYDRVTGHWHRWPLPKGDAAWIDSDGTRLVASFGEHSSFVQFDGRGGWPELASLPAGDLPANPVSTLLWHNGQLWCGHERALSRLDPSTGAWKTYPLPADTRVVQHLAADGETVWAGLFKGGVVELNTRTGTIRRWVRPLDQPRDENAGSNLSVEGVITDSRYLYVLTHLGLYRLDRQTGAQRYLNLQNFGAELHGGGGAVLQSDGRLLWLVTEVDDATKSRVVRFSLPDLKPEVLPNPLGLDEFGPHATEPGRGVWFLRDGPKLASLDGRELAHFPLPRRFRTQIPQALAWSPGFIWCAAASRAPETPYVPIISRVRLSDGQWQTTAPCPLTGVRQLLVAGDSLWAATANGLARLPLRDLHAEPLAQPDRAPLQPEREIFLALGQRDFAEVKQLLDSGVPVDVHPFRGRTPLMEAVSLGWLEMVRYLLDRGARVNATDEDGTTPLAHTRQVEVARLLLEHGADPNVLSGKNGYPLLIERLVREREEGIARLLIEKGADVNVQEPAFGMTPLTAAIRWPSKGFVPLLLERGAKVNVQDKEGNTPLMSAIGTGDQETIHLLLEHGADINAANKDGDTALHVAARSYGVESLDVLLRKGALLEAVGKHGWTPLLAAAAGDNFAAVPVLVKAGANVNALSRTGQTTLMFAARRRQVDAVKFLLAKGARVNVKDAEGKTASKIARESGALEIANLLRAAGEKQ